MKLLQKRKQDHCLSNSFPMDISIRLDSAKHQAHYNERFSTVMLWKSCTGKTASS